MCVECGGVCVCRVCVVCGVCRVCVVCGVCGVCRVCVVCGVCGVCVALNLRSKLELKGMYSDSCHEISILLSSL